MTYTRLYCGHVLTNYFAAQIDTGIMMPLGLKASSPFGASLGVRPNHVPTWSDIFVYYSTIEGKFE